ncbi:MAG: phosphoglucosamine mutase [Bacteroidales bacterium]|nr:phosphoglucosamine mutase [Bacteroidales bacterium]MBP5764504.1 phosphoglucosamine mutase [Bacteroidales bacterium]
MSLIKSISGIRGTIGGQQGEGLNPLDIVKFTAAFATVIRENIGNKRGRIVVGRDARLSGEMLYQCVSGTLVGMGFDVINIGLATTPTTEMAVTAEKADGGLILTASHNPIQWNALKLLNRDGEFFDKATGERVLAIAEKGNFQYAEVHDLGHITEKDYTDYHIEQVLNLKLVNKEAIEKANFTVMCDCINSVGGIVIPRLLKALGVKQVYELNCTPNGQFAHTPEPIPQNLTQISGEMKQKKADIGFVVDPDVDRLALICENGEMFGEEYTLVSVADYVLQHTPGNTVSNLSSSRALRDVTRARGGQYNAAAVGEVNVVAKMKETNAVIGGEGNGGVIYPEIHYGRDALVGVALFLTQLALLRQQNPKLTVSELRATYPPYCIAKQRIDLTPDIDIDKLLNTVKTEYSKLPDTEISDIDGVKIDFTDRWVHLRKSNTEPIIRVYAEAATEELAQQTADSVMQEVIKMKQ